MNIIKRPSSFSLIKLPQRKYSKRVVNLSYNLYDENSDVKKSPVVFLHGLFGNKLNWQSHCREVNWKTKRKVLAYDAVNHGQSDHRNEMSYKDMAEDLINLLDTLNIDKAITVGHSMGGKTVMANALFHPERVDKLIVVDAAPSVSMPSDVGDYLTAMKNINVDRVKTRQDVESQLENVVKSKSVRQFLLTNLLKSQDGKFYWRINLDALSTYYLDHIHGFPPINSTFEKDTLFLQGGRSNYIRTDNTKDIYRYFPKATIRLIPDAGHWIHSEKPKEFLEALLPFIGS